MRELAASMRKAGLLLALFAAGAVAQQECLNYCERIPAAERSFCTDWCYRASEFLGGNGLTEDDCSQRCV